MKRTYNVFSVLFLLLLTFLLNMTFSGLIPFKILQIIRAVLTVIFFVLAWSSKIDKNYSSLFKTLGLVTLSFLLLSFFSIELLGESLNSPRGVSIAKLSDSFIISAVVLIGLLSTGVNAMELFLSKGKLGPGITIGIISFGLMSLITFMKPGNELNFDFLAKNYIWIIIFIFSNAFMEELLFRGVFFKDMVKLMSPFWMIVLTSIVFGIAHMQIGYSTDIATMVIITFFFGLIWGTLIYYTRSLIASILFHAGADLVLIIPIFDSFGAI